MRCATTTHRRRLRVEDFGTPESLLVAPDVSRERKRELLEGWSRILAVEIGSGRRSGTHAAELLRRVRSAIDLLDRPRADIRRLRGGVEHAHAASSGRRQL